MTQSIQNVPTPWRCPTCGLLLPRNIPTDCCPKCLLKAGRKPVNAMADTLVSTIPPVPRSAGPQVGGVFGHYRLERVLGTGGMGAVYEAHDVESDRRVALKVLSLRFDSPEPRKRFLREGHIAASINHPHSVYVFGCEEIDGLPVIAMEVMSGGTLQDRIGVRGPLSFREATDVILQVIDGLEAAHGAGILHRDIKPSNCFMDASGTVKIGDFGLSIQMETPGDSRITAQETFMGTPAFVSPEQLRGDALTVRSDVYSVGVTLFYLLTGRLPHEASDTIRLLTKVLENPAPSPAQYDPDVPRKLCRIVQRCLAKTPEDRFEDYPDLRRALARFSSTGIAPAALGVRLLAGVVDAVVTGLPLLLLWCAPVFHLSWLTQHDSIAMLVRVVMIGASAVFAISCLALQEGVAGRSLGKALMGLWVYDPANPHPDWGKSFARATIVVLFLGGITWSFMGDFNSLSKVTLSSGTLRSMMGLCAGTALLFAGASRRNGFAALQDRLTNTRVVTVARPVVRPAVPPVDLPAGFQSKPKIGPYQVLEKIGGSENWIEGYDGRLRRRVWIHRVPDGTPGVSKTVRHLSRAGRIRWLDGRRAKGNNWDAYERLTGQPLLTLIQQPQPWQAVRLWLLDLAREIQESCRDGSLPGMLDWEQVWITGEGRAKLLDDTPPGIPGKPVRKASPGETVSAPPLLWPVARTLLSEVAVRALAGQPAGPAVLCVPVPLHVREFLDQLPTLPGPDEVVAHLKSILGHCSAVSRARRFGITTCCIAPSGVGALLATLFKKPGATGHALEWAWVPLLVCVVLPAVAAAAWGREGLVLRAFGVTVVGMDGKPASRFRKVGRTLAAWIPCLVAPFPLVLLTPWTGLTSALALVLGPLVVVTAMSAAWPQRGIPDLMAGTCLVPE